MNASSRSRIRRSMALAMTLGLLAVSPTTAVAAGPTSIDGVVWLDLNGDGVKGASETGFTGAVVKLYDKDGTLVGTVTTTATGAYSFTGLTPGQGPYSASITRSTTTYPDPSNWVISAAPGPDASPYVGTDNDAVPTSDPRVGTIANMNTGTSYDVAMRPRPELSLGFFGPGIIDGTGPFNTLGGCSSGTALGQPGDDCGTSNGQLRTGDTLTTVWSVTADNFEPGTTSWGDMVFEQTIVPTGGAVANFASIPVSCLPPPNGTGGTGLPASAILTNYPVAGQTTLRCNLGQFVEGGQESLTTAIKLSALSPNGSSFTTTEKVYAGATGDRAVPAIGPAVGPILASARPAFDLVKLPFRNVRTETRCVDTDSDPATPCENLKGYTLDTIIRLTAAQKVGIEGLQQPYTFTDTVSAQLNGGASYPVEYYLAYCYPNDSGWGDTVLGRPYGRTPTSDPTYYPRTVDESGTCTPTRATGAATTTPYTISISGTDLDGSRFPTATWGGTDLSAGPFIVAEQRVGVFVPFRSVDATDGTTNGAGSMMVYNRYSGFDPTGISGTSNFGTGFEPGYCAGTTGTCDPTSSTVATSNNVIGPNTIMMSTTGGMSKYQMYRADNWGQYTIQPGSGATHDGAGLTEPGDYSASWINFQNSGSNDIINPGVCDVFDNTVWKLTTADKVQYNTLQPANPSSTYAYVTRLNTLDTNYNSAFSTAWPTSFRAEYASIPVDYDMDGTGPDTGDNPLYNASRAAVAGVIDSGTFTGLDTYNTATGRYEGVWASQKSIRCTNAAAASTGGWKTDPNAVPGGVNAVNAVRIVPIDPSYALVSGGYVRAVVPLQTRSVFNGGPYSGQVIPAGTVFADLGMIRADNLNYGGALGNWRPAAYQPSPETTDTDGDRSTLSRFNTRLQKHTLTPATNVGATTSTLAGNQIVWELIPAVQTTLSPSAEIAKNVTVTDVLPPYTTFNAACTAALNNSTATSTILPVNVEANTGLSGPQAGYTKLTYQLGNLPVNQAIPRIRICTDTDALAPNGTSVTNVGRITADDDITALATRQDDHTIVLEQNGSMQISKSVDRRLDPLNDSQVYTVEYANFASAFPINPPTIIDVFPWNGDTLGTLSERDPASGYHGTLTLTASPTVTFKNGSVPGASDPNPAIGTFYYTKDASSTVNYNPDANTSKWCSTSDGGTTWTPQAPAVAADCPTSLAQVTAFKFVSNYALDLDGKPRQGQKITFTLQASGNQPSDHYTNRATVDSTSLPASQFLRSNNVIVQVPSYNLGDLVFGDLNRNGVYDPAADIVAPSGVEVDLYQSGQTPGVDSPYRTTTTNAAGRYQFTLLGDGEYFVVIPASQFATGGPLAGWALDPAGLQADPNTNRNDTSDHHAIGLNPADVSGGVRSTGLLTLSATVPANPLIAPTGNEPLGDNTGNLPAAVSDDFTNYTLDLGLIPPSSPSLALKKYTNTVDADSATGPNIPAGGSVLWCYELRNTGDRPMVGVSITDDAGTPSDPTDDWTMTKASGYVSGDTDGDGALDLTEVWIFTHTGTATVGQYGNKAVVTAQAADNANNVIAALGSFTASDPSHYWGAQPGVTVKKYTNGLDADTAPGPLVMIGSTVTWTYVATNTGNVPLTVAVTDDKIAAASINCGQGTGNTASVPVGGQVTCTATGTATAGQYGNTGTATGTPPATVSTTGASVPGVPVTATDPSHYFGADPKITVVKSINGSDANATPGVQVSYPGTLSISFLVTNTGNVRLDPVTVSDDTVAASDIACPAAALDPGASMTCTASYVAPLPGIQHTDKATVTGQPPTLTDGTVPGVVTASDVANAYSKPLPSISVVKYINAQDADTAPGPQIVTGDTVNVTFQVTNTGNTRLDPVVVTDDTLTGPISCPASALDVGKSMTCTASFVAPAPNTQHTDTAKATGTPAMADGTHMKDLATGTTLPTVNDTNPANAITVQPGVYIVKKINGLDANAAPGQLVIPGSTMNVTFFVANIGSTPLDPVKVTDDVVPASAISCPKTTLAVGEDMTCSATYTAPAAGVQHTDTATSTATGVVNGTPLPTPISDTDPANALGAKPGISIVKSINGSDANSLSGGVSVAPGGTLNITFDVTNTGNTTLSDVAVTDSVVPVGAISCPKSVLAPGESMTCTAVWSAPASGAPHSDTGTATGKPVQNDGSPIVDPTTGTPMDPVNGDDPAFAYTPAHPKISIVKSINGDDANATPGVAVAEGSTMAITFVVTNTGDVKLSPVTVTDDTVGAVTCPASALEPGQNMTCTASYAAPTIGVQHTDNATATGTPVQDDGSRALGANGVPLDDVTANDPAHAWVKPAPAITAVKSINGLDVNTAPGVQVVTGDTVNVSFLVTNTGNTKLSPVSVSDDKLTNVSCPDTSLEVGKSMTCTASFVAPASGTQHTNTATASGTPAMADGTPMIDLTTGQPLADVRATDPANAIAVQPGVSIVKSINGDNADTAPGVPVTAGSSMNVTFLVTNTASTPLASITVTDSAIAASAISCPATTLAIGESMTCTASLTAPPAGATHTDTASVEATGIVNGQPYPGTVTASDMAHAYAPAHPAVTIVKSINDDDANDGLGVAVAAGSDMAVTFLVTNTGDVRLSPVVISDDPASTITCPASALDAGASMTCTATVVAPGAGATHHDNATVTGTPVLADGSPALGPDGTALSDASASDPANAYTPPHPAITLVKKVNGADANTAPGALVKAGDPVAWTFEVTNTGDVPLSDVKVDDPTLTVSCPAATLAVAASMTCTASGTAVVGQVTNMAKASGTGPTLTAFDGTTLPGETVTGDDPANYFGSSPAVTIVKSVNGSDANAAPGVLIKTGDPVSWTYLVTNTGNVPLAGLGVSDDQGVTVICPADTLAVDAAMTCSASGTAVAGQYTNLGTVTGHGPDTVAADGSTVPGKAVEASDPANYFGSSPAVTIVKSVNGSDADAAPGVTVKPGDPISWTYVVTNTGNVALAGLSVSDDKLIAVTCPGDTLAVGDHMTCTASGTATVGQYTNNGTVTGHGPETTATDGSTVPGAEVSASNPANAFGSVPAISVVKRVQTVWDANLTPNFPFITVGQVVRWTYEVTNTGNVDLNAVSVTDDVEGAITCPKAVLAVGETMTCTLNGTAIEGPYTNTGTASGTGPDVTNADGTTSPGASVESSDPASYVGISPSISVVKSVNGSDANAAPGVLVKAGDPVKWTYVVTNTGDATLTNVHLTDVPAEQIDCPKATLAVAESMTCTATGTAVVGDYANTVTAYGTAPDTVAADGSVVPGVEVTANDPAHYYGTKPSISVIKSVNGSDANAAPGVWVEPGSTVTWTFEVTNTGNVPLTDVAVTDDKTGPVTCPESTLAAGASMTCTVTGTAQADGQYTNLGTVTGTAPDTHATDGSVVAGGTVTSNDPANYRPTLRLGDRVWVDANANGVQDAGEVGLDGVPVTLLDSSGQPAVDAYGHPVPAQTTSGGGQYLFTGLLPGTYRVVFGLLPGYAWSPATSGDDPALDSDAVGTGPLAATASAGVDLQHPDLTVDAGLAQLVSVGDFVWMDVNGSGVQDAGEPGVAGVRVNLYDADGVFVTSVDTDADGHYAFTGLLPATGYAIEFVKPDGSVFSPVGVGADRAVDSDADASGRTTFVTPNGGANWASEPDLATIDAGLIQFNLRLTKTTAAMSATVGQTVTFTLTPHNDGPSDAAAGWSVVEVGGTGLQVVSMSGTGYTCTGSTCVAASALPVDADGASVTVTMKVTSAGSLTNRAYVAPVDGGVETNPLTIPDQTTDAASSSTDNDASASLTGVDPVKPIDSGEVGVNLPIAGVGALLLLAGGLVIAARRRVGARN